jgi:hypothetical protein
MLQAMNMVFSPLFLLMLGAVTIQHSCRERAEQERAERAERAAAIKELLAELTDEARGAAGATKEAAGELREVQRENGAVLKQVAAAEAAIAEADEDLAQVGGCGGCDGAVCECI